MKIAIIILCFTASFVAAFPAYSFEFEDSFESGNMSATDSDGFAWAANNKTSVVTINAPCSSPGKSVAVYNNKVICNEAIPTQNWQAKDGNYSLRFRYPAGVNQWAEQRFDLGAPHRDLWIRFWVRVPVNFSHGVTNGYAAGTNNKLFAIWMDDYDTKGDGPTVVWSFWNDGNNGSNATFCYSTGNHTAAGRQLQQTHFISYPSDQGRWMQVVFHVKAAINSTSNDGVIQMWRRWDGETNYTKIHELLDANNATPPTGPNGWRHGYLMGWSNPGYANETDWLIDDVTFSDTCLLGINCVANPDAPSSVR